MWEHSEIFKIPNLLRLFQVILECAGLCQTVFLVTGMCQAVDIKLDTTSVPFGAVVTGSQSSRAVVMQNLGDIGARFSWNMSEFSSDFSVEPVKGYSSPGTEVSFNLKFCPQNVSQDIRSEVRYTEDKGLVARCNYNSTVERCEIGKYESS